MKNYIKLIRPKDWAKNLFLYIPLFFGGLLFDLHAVVLVFEGFICFSMVASSIYIINDYRDIEDDQKHPEKRKRVLASGLVNKNVAILIAVLLLAGGLIYA